MLYKDYAILPIKRTICIEYKYMYMLDIKRMQQFLRAVIYRAYTYTCTKKYSMVNLHKCSCSFYNSGLPNPIYSIHV